MIRFLNHEGTKDTKKRRHQYLPFLYDYGETHAMPNKLPEEFQFCHKLCMEVCDRLSKIVADGMDNGDFNTTIPIGNESEHALFESDPWAWLEAKRSRTALGTVLFKTVFPALLTDFCSFMEEALSCSERGKLTAAYALLRKPLLENLHYIEWLAAHPKGMLNAFYNRKPTERATGFLRSKPKRILGVIQKAIQRTAVPTLYDAELIWQARYDKKSEFSFDIYSNQALHLVTTKDAIATEKQNFNFIFSDDECRHWQWEHIFRTLPYLLVYAEDVSSYLMSLTLGRPIDDYESQMYKRVIVVPILGCEVAFANEDIDRIDQAREGLRLITGTCPGCSKLFALDESLARDLYVSDECKCPNCTNAVTFASFFVLEN